MNRSLLRLLPAVAAVAALVPAALALGGPAPEADALLPDLDQETPSGLVLTKARGGWRLGFDSAVRNVGTGPLIIDGARPEPSVETMSADQVIVHDGSPRTVVPSVGELRYVRSPDHRHWHLLGFDRYELRRADSGETWWPIARPASASATATPCARARCPPSRSSRSTGAAAGSTSRACSASARASRPATATTTRRTSRVSTCRCAGCARVATCSCTARTPTTASSSRRTTNNASSLLLSLRRRGGEPKMRILGVCPDTEHCTAKR